MISCNHTLIWD